MHEKIKQKRLDKFMSKAELSRLSGVSKSYITEIEQGIKVPSVTILKKLAKVLKCDVKDFL